MPRLLWASIIILHFSLLNIRWPLSPFIYNCVWPFGWLICCIFLFLSCFPIQTDFVLIADDLNSDDAFQSTRSEQEKNNNASIYGNYWCNTCNSTCKIPCAWPKLFITLAWHTGPACIHRVCAVHSGIQLKRGEIAVQADSGKNEKKRKYANRYTVNCDGKKEKKKLQKIYINF